MSKDEIQDIIRMTINELKCQGLLVEKESYNEALEKVEPVLREYFTRKNNKKIESFLVEHSDDTYIDIIYLHYRDGITIGRMADILDKDISTIKRNKKRLIKSINKMLQGGA